VYLVGVPKIQIFLTFDNFNRKPKVLKAYFSTLSRSNGEMQMNDATNTAKCVVPVFKSPNDYQAYRISPESTNRLAIVFDPMNTRMPITYCVEIFDVDGQTPPNRHQMAVEMFFVLKGEGVAMCDGKAVDIRAGDSVMVPPTGMHVIANTGTGRLYTLSIMVPNEDFAELIRSGIPVALDAEDMAVLRRSDALPVQA
jgi:mannose-6-phosphate isomerase-like protein (cupin superfamily)